MDTLGRAPIPGDVVYLGYCGSPYFGGLFEVEERLVCTCGFLTCRVDECDLQSKELYLVLNEIDPETVLTEREPFPYDELPLSLAIKERNFMLSFKGEEPVFND